MATFNPAQEEELRAQLGEPTLSLSREQVTRIVLSEIRFTSTAPTLSDGSYMAFPCADGGMDIFRVDDELLPTTEPDEFIAEKIDQESGDVADIRIQEWDFQPQEEQKQEH